jgi:hypothetical protein
LSLIVEPRGRRYVINAQADAALERWTIGALTGAPVAFPTTPAIAVEAFIRYAEFHGVISLLYARLGSATPGFLPGEDWIAALTTAARFQAVSELLQRQALIEVITAAQQRGIRLLLLKGAALAFSVYPEPSQRARADTDVLIALQDKASMTAMLEAMGYVGDLIAAQHWATSERTFAKTATAGVSSRLDVHWRINNSPLFWHAQWEQAQLIDEAQPLPRLHSDARCPDMATLLLHACLHRASHFGAPMSFGGEAHNAVNRLIWLYDIHLLSAALSDAGWRKFLASATELGLRSICHSAFVATADRFGTRVPIHVLDRVAHPGRESASGLLDGTPLRIKLSEFRALPSASARLGWLREHLLPRRAYMRAKYPDHPRAPLPILHLKRWLPSRRPF